MLTLLSFWRWVTATAWPWLKRNWLWVLLAPVALVIYLAGKRAGKVVVVEDDHESDDAREVQRKIEEAQKKAHEELQRKAQEESKNILAENQETIEQMTEAERAKAAELLSDPKKLNDYLLDVGRRVREGG